MSKHTLIIYLLVLLLLCGCENVNFKPTPKEAVATNAWNNGVSIIEFNEDLNFNDDETAFQIELPYASFDYGRCILTSRNHCDTVIDHPENVLIKNSFEIWQEMQLTFSIVPNCGEVLSVNGLESISLQRYDVENRLWIDENFQVLTPSISLFNNSRIKFTSICDSDGLTGHIHNGAAMVTLGFHPPKNFDNDKLLYKLTVHATTYNPNTGEASNETISSTRFIEYMTPNQEDVTSIWTGIDVSENQVAEANDRFSIFAPKDLNPILYSYPVQTKNDFLKLVLSFDSMEPIEFSSGLGLEAYQFVEATHLWSKIDPPSGQNMNSIERLIYSPIHGETICDGCKMLYTPVTDLLTQMLLPRLMSTNGNDYLVFSVNINVINLDPEIDYLRILIRNGDNIAYTDLFLRRATVTITGN